MQCQNHPSSDYHRKYTALRAIYVLNARGVVAYTYPHISGLSIVCGATVMYDLHTAEYSFGRDNKLFRAFAGILSCIGTLFLGFVTRNRRARGVCRPFVTRRDI